MSYRQAKRERCHSPTFLALLGTLLIAATLSPPPARAQDPSCAPPEAVTIVVYPSDQQPADNPSDTSPLRFGVFPKDVDPWDDDGTSGGGGGGLAPGVVIVGSGPVYVIVLGVDEATVEKTLTPALSLGEREPELP